MKIFTLISFILLSACSASDAQILSLTLNSAIDIALSNNYFLQEQEQEVKIAASLHRQARAGYLPRLEAIFSASYFENHPYISYRQNYQADLVLTQRLIDLKQLFDIRSSAFQKQYQQYSLESQKQNVIFNTIRLFYGALLMRENLQVRENALHLAKEQKRIAAIRYEQGEVSSYDLLRAESNLLSADAELKQAAADYDKSLNELSLFLGYPARMRLAPEGEFHFHDTPRDIVFPDQALQEHPRVNAALSQIGAKSAELSAARGEFLPRITLEALGASAKEQAQAPNRKAWEEYWAGYIRVSLPLFEGGRRYYRIKQARQGLEKIELQKSFLINELEKGIYSFYGDYRAALDIAASQKKNLEKAEELYSLVRDRYIYGESSEIEFLDAYLNLISTQLAHKRALYNTIVSYCGMLYSAGRLNQEALSSHLNITYSNAGLEYSKPALEHGGQE